MTTDPFILGEALGFKLNRLALLFRRHLIRALSEYDLQPEQWQVLASLQGNKKPVSQGELARITLKDRHSLSRMLDRMEKKGWVQRRVDVEDSRVNLIGLTAQAEQQFEGIKGKLVHHFEQLLQSFDPMDQAALSQLASRLLLIIEED